MSLKHDRHTKDAMPAEVSEALGEAHTPAVLTPESETRLRREVLARVASERSAQPAFLTMHADEGEWSSIAPGIRKKPLYVDTIAGTESYLLSLDPGAVVPTHRHSGTELCLVVEGTVSFGEIHLSVGGWHVAHRESVHANVFSEAGAVLFVQGPLETGAAAL
ncbi:MAG: cupin domain-containing protein [Pseudomonadota bacterium]|nr:cupin domain-containing protein [Pseudomonadota bacterium]